MENLTPIDGLAELKRRVEEQYRALCSLVSSLDGVDGLGSFTARLDGLHRALSFYADSVGVGGAKQAYYCYMTEYTYRFVRQLKEKITEGMIEKWCVRRNMARPKYLRKFANDAMTIERLNIPESVADFIQG